VVSTTDATFPTNTTSAILNAARPLAESGPGRIKQLHMEEGGALGGKQSEIARRSGGIIEASGDA